MGEFQKVATYRPTFASLDRAARRRIYCWSIAAEVTFPAKNVGRVYVVQMSQGESYAVDGGGAMRRGHLVGRGRPPRLR